MDPTGEATPAWSIPSYGIPDHHQQGSGVHGLAPQNGPPHDLQADAAKLCKPLDVDPLTMASPDEPVTYTPEWLLNHPAYSFGWRVYQYEKKTTGVKYKTYKNPIYGTIRSKVQVVQLLDRLNSERNRKGKEKVGFPSNDNSGIIYNASFSQSYNGNNAA